MNFQFGSYLRSNFIKRNYDKFIKHDYEGLSAYYHFDEGVGHIAYDATLNYNN